MEEKCYKICLQKDDIQDFNKLLDSLSQIGDISFFNGDVYIWLNEGKNKKSLLYQLKYNKIKEFFCQALKYKDVQDKHSYLETWYNQHYSQVIIKDFEEKQQELLIKANENVKRLVENFEEIVKSAQASKKEDTVIDNREG